MAYFTDDIMISNIGETGKNSLFYSSRILDITFGFNRDTAIVWDWIDPDLKVTLYDENNKPISSMYSSHTKDGWYTKDTNEIYRTYIKDGQKAIGKVRCLLDTSFSTISKITLEAKMQTKDEGISKTYDLSKISLCQRLSLTSKLNYNYESKIYPKTDFDSVGEIAITGDLQEKTGKNLCIKSFKASEPFGFKYYGQDVSSDVTAKIFVIRSATEDLEEEVVESFDISIGKINVFDFNREPLWDYFFKIQFYYKNKAQSKIFLLTSLEDFSFFGHLYLEAKSNIQIHAPYIKDNKTYSRRGVIDYSFQQNTDMNNKEFWNYLTRIGFFSTNMTEEVELWNKDNNSIQIKKELFYGMKEFEDVLNITEEEVKWYIFDFDFGNGLVAQSFISFSGDEYDYENLIIYKEPLFIPNVTISYPDTILLEGEHIEFSIESAYDPNNDITYPNENSDYSLSLSYNKINNVSKDFSEVNWGDRKIDDLSYTNLKTDSDKTEFVMIRVKIDLQKNGETINSNYYYPTKEIGNEQIIFQLGRIVAPTFSTVTVENNELTYVLKDYGGDKNDLYPASHFLNEIYSSLFRRGKEIELKYLIKTIDHKNNNKTEFSTIDKLIEIQSIKNHIIENVPKTILLKNNLDTTEKTNYFIIQYVFSDNTIIEAEYPLNSIKAIRPTVSRRKNGIIINGTPGASLQNDDFIEINALSPKKTISINYFSEEGSLIKTGTIKYDETRKVIILKGFVIEE